MSLENFLTMNKKRDTRKKSYKPVASEVLANPDNETEPDSD